MVRCSQQPQKAALTMECGVPLPRGPGCPYHGVLGALTTVCWVPLPQYAGCLSRLLCTAHIRVEADLSTKKYAMSSNTVLLVDFLPPPPTPRPSTEIFLIFDEDSI